MRLCGGPSAPCSRRALVERFNSLKGCLTHFMETGQSWHDAVMCSFPCMLGTALCCWLL